MSKETIIKIITISVILVLISVIFNKCIRSLVNNTVKKSGTTIVEMTSEESVEYSLEEKPIKYNADTEKGREEYYSFIDKYIHPIKLKKFINYSQIYLDDLYLNLTGNDVLEYIVLFEGYQHLFENMFDKNRTNFDDCPITKKFLKKFNTNLTCYFDLSYDEVWIDVWPREKMIKVEARSGISLDGEAEYSMLYRFKYTLDEEGNVDDVILEHVGWD